ncbi:MAG: CoA transferase [Gammaproteobacteria bacterium]|nr:MAG: CoA transferase [Gammaproteobacteria bacterium]
MGSQMGVLAGKRVLDFGRYIAGPFCGAMLADLGADVIRIEKVDGSEDRYTAPVAEVDGREIGSLFLHLNRNKRGFTFNPKKPGAGPVLQRLVESADLVLANLTPSGVTDIGLDYANLCRIKPDIILVTSTAYGSHGPYGDRVGFDGVAQAMSGNLHLSGSPDAPSRNFFPYVDFMTGALNTIGALSAFMHRDKTGEGQHVEGALLASALTIAGGTLIEQALTNVNRIASGNRGQTAAPSDVYQTKDGWVLVSVVGNPLFARWARLLGKEAWLDDPRFATDTTRGKHCDAITEVMIDWIQTRTTAEAMQELDSARIPCGEVLSPAEALVHEQVSAMKYLVDIEFPGLTEPYPLPRTPIEFSAADVLVAPSRPPLLGEHTDEILSDLGFDDAEIESLHKDRVV